MKVVGIHQPQYLPYLGFFHKIFHSDVFVILDSVQFQKHGLQNRNRIKTGQGWQWLTVPVLHRFGQRIHEVSINPKVRWGRKHWHALTTNYSRAPYLCTYGPELKDLLERDWTSLCQLNVALIRWVMRVLDVKTPLIYSSELDVDGTRAELLINICKAVGADSYLSGPGGRRYMDLAAFEAAGLTVLWQDFTPPVYDQMFPAVGFVPNLSIVDTLFCCGPATRQFLQSGPTGRGFVVGAYSDVEPESAVSATAGVGEEDLEI